MLASCYAYAREVDDMTHEQSDALRSRLDGPARKVATAVRAWGCAYSEFPGQDCVMLSHIARRLFADLGITVEVCVGYAAWRVGPAEFEVVGHVPEPWEAESGLHHAWVEYETLIVDITTFQIVRKVRDLDADLKRKTTIDWCPPDYLIASPQEIRSFDDVCNGTSPGWFYYERRRELETTLQNKLDTVALEANVRMARFILGAVTVDNNTGVGMDDGIYTTDDQGHRGGFIGYTRVLRNGKPFWYWPDQATADAFVAHAKRNPHPYNSDETLVYLYAFKGGDVK